MQVLDGFFSQLPVQAELAKLVRGREPDRTTLAEAFYENRISARCRLRDPSAAVFDHSLFRQQDGRELVRARTVWRRIE